MRNQLKTLGAIALVVVIGVGVGSFFYNRSDQSRRITSNTGKNTGISPTSEQLVRPDSPTLGPADARVTLVEFYDPECEACASFHPIVKKILKDYDGKIRLVTRYMSLHPSSMAAATFTEAAGEQGKYWQAQELLFNKQSEWGQKHGQPSATVADVNALFEKYAMELGLDLVKLNSAIKENRFLEKINRDKNDGQAVGVRQTPTFFVNGRKLMQFSEAALRQMIDAELAN